MAAYLVMIIIDIFFLKTKKWNDIKQATGQTHQSSIIQHVYFPFVLSQ